MLSAPGSNAIETKVAERVAPGREGD